MHFLLALNHLKADSAHIPMAASATASRHPITTHTTHSTDHKQSCNRNSVAMPAAAAPLATSDCRPVGYNLTASGRDKCAINAAMATDNTPGYNGPLTRPHAMRRAENTD